MKDSHAQKTFSNFAFIVDSVKFYSIRLVIKMIDYLSHKPNSLSV